MWVGGGVDHDCEVTTCSDELFELHDPPTALPSSLPTTLRPACLLPPCAPFSLVSVHACFRPGNDVYLLHPHRDRVCVVPTLLPISCAPLRTHAPLHTTSPTLTLRHFSQFGCHEVELTANVTKNIQLKLPFISSPMDTVTEHSMATAMALQGGMGVIHRNCTVEYQCGEVRSTKAHQNGFISNPMCVGPESTIEDLDALTYTAFPVTDTGAVGGKLLGIVTSRDIDFVVDRKSRCADVMTKFSDMVTVEEGITLDEARKVVVASKKGKVPVVNASGDIVSMISRRDIVLQQDFPDASQNKKEQLLVGAACGVDQPDDRERLDALAAMGVDVVVLDATQGHSTAQIEQLNYCKRAFPDIDVIAGNVVTEKQVRQRAGGGECEAGKE